MKAVFIHDHNFVYNPETNLYYDGSGGAFDGNLWKRYLAIFDELTVTGRQIEKLPNKLVLSSASNVRFHLVKGANGFKNILKNKGRIKRELQNTIKKADFVIIRLPSTLGRWAFDICKSLNKKYVLEIVGDPFEAYWYHGNWAGKIVAPLELLRLKRIVRNAEHVIYVTKKMLQKRYPCLNFTCSISNVRLEGVINEEAINDFYNKREKVFKIGLIGTFHAKYKGHVEALRAIRFLKDKGHSSIELSLVGTGDPGWVKRLAKKFDVERQVKIVGAVSAGEDGIFPFLDKMHLYVHPSKTEGLPRVILEAMSRGKMCLGSNVGGTVELLNREYIHEPGNWKSLASQIEGLLTCSTNKKVDIARTNLYVAKQYLETVLQQRRCEFINKIIGHESDQNSA